MVEQKLLELCERLDLVIPIRAKDNDSLDKGIRRARKFLIRGKNYTIDEHHWKNLVEIGRTRNIIVHQGRILSYTYQKPEKQFTEYTFDNGQKVYLLIEKSTFQYLQQHGILEHAGSSIEITPSFDYCKSLIDLSRDMFKKIYSDLGI